MTLCGCELMSVIPIVAVAGFEFQINWFFNVRLPPDLHWSRRQRVVGQVRQYSRR